MQNQIHFQDGCLEKDGCLKNLKPEVSTCIIDAH